MSESTVIETYGAIIVQSIPNFWISVWAYCSRTVNPLASINSNECTALQLLTLARFLNFIPYTKYECTVVPSTCVLIMQWFKSENSRGSIDSYFAIYSATPRRFGITNLHFLGDSPLTYLI